MKVVVATAMSAAVLALAGCSWVDPALLQGRPLVCSISEPPFPEARPAGHARRARGLARAVTLLLALAALGSCTAGGIDSDGDGSLDSEDCAPDDPDIHPGANDPYGDGEDQNCDGVPGFDGDGDGYAAQDDCNDNNATMVISTSPLNLKSPLIAVEDIKVGSGYWGVFGGSVGRCERTIAELPRR